ncbi:MAG: extracellular solute-binding protein [Lachnospiraceae bacterium]|nr:extracellular solute-binding protein [Lachnospiraceae bacterium]
MMKNNFYTSVTKTIFVFLVMICVVSLAACSKNDNVESRDDDDKYVFSESFTLGDNRLAPGNAGCIYVRDDKVYYVTEGEYDDSKGINKNYMCMCDLADGSVTELFQINTDDNGNVESDRYKSEWLEAVSADDNGNISVIIRSSIIDDGGRELASTLKRYLYAPDGQIQDTCDIQMDTSKLSDNGMIKNCRIASQGDIYILYESFENEGAVLYRFNPDGSAASNYDFRDMRVKDITLDADDRPIVTYEDGTTDTDIHTSAMYIDMEKGSQGPKIDGIVNGTDDIYRDYTLYTGGSSFLINDNRELSTYDSSTGTESKICEWMDCGLLGSHVIFVCMCKNGNIFCMYNDGDSIGDLENVMAGFIEKKDASDDDRPLIKVASYYDNDMLQKAIIKLNRSNEKYKVEYVSYGKYADGIDKMKYDIISGNVPDVILLNDAMGINNFIARGLLEDLSPYIKNDDVVNEDFFLDGYLDAVSVNNKNYFISNSFSIDVLVGKKSDLSEFDDGWSVDEFIEYYKSKPEGTKIFANTSKQGLCFTLLGQDMGNYMDWDEGRCSFDSDKFRKLLEFCSGFENGDMFDDYDMGDHIQPIKEGKLLLEKAYISTGADVQIYGTVFGDDEMFIGYPSDSDSGVYVAGGGLGVFSSSEYKDEAWDFIKQIITDEDDDSDIVSMNASKDGFEKIFRKESAPHSDGSHIMNGIVSEPAKKEDADVVKELLKKAVYRPYVFEEYEIIKGDIDSYFAGEKGLDETVKVIQDRMEKYVNENK